VWRRSGKMPAPLAEEPTLEDHEIGYFEVFSGLSSSRSYADGSPQPIRVSEVLAYCQLMGIDRLEQRQDTLQMVQALDGVWMTHQVEKISRSRSQAAAGNAHTRK
jgi:hypothetical protein